MRTLIVKLMVLAGTTLSTVSAQLLPTQRSTLFSGSGNCAVCHSAGGSNSNVLRDGQGNDIAPPAQWRSTMMANAAKDPFWQAKVSAEIAAHPQFKQFIEDKCTTCHSPMGRTEAHYLGREYYSMQEMNVDPLAMDGVSCTACHQIKDVNLGKPESFSGHYVIENDHLIYGPYENPFAMPMQNMSGYRPVAGEQVHTSELCATCHTLFTPTVDNNGEIVGEAPEQTPYLEWKNSRFQKEGVECQSCHMPDIDDAIVISNRPMMNLRARTPFAKHYFVGGNVFMLRILKEHAAELGVTATASHFDSTISRTLRLLQQETAELSAQYAWDASDTLVVKIAVKNISGHKFPTAYPSRRAWLYFDVTNNSGRSMFTSGAWNTETGEIIDLDEPYEKHHDIINNPRQTQVYQPLMSDVDGNVNYTLLRAAGYIKDNRIPPEGFTTAHATYDSVAIEGLAASDSNFNIADGVQGSGADTVSYRIGGLNPANAYNIDIKLLYQSHAPRFVEDLFQYSTPEVERFKGYYRQTENRPVTIDSIALAIIGAGVKEKKSSVPKDFFLASVYPNPFNPGTTITVQTGIAGRLKVDIYDVAGNKVRGLAETTFLDGEHRFRWNAQDDFGRHVASGHYFVRIILQDSQSGQVYRRVQKATFLK